MVGKRSIDAEADMAKLVAIRSAHGLPEALVAKSYLEAHGLVVALNGYYHGANAWYALFALQGIQICVLNSGSEVAAALLEVPETDTSRVAVTPRPTMPEGILAAIALLAFGLPLPLWLRRRRCASS